MNSKVLGPFFAILICGAVAQGETKFMFRETIDNAATVRTLRLLSDTGQVVFYESLNGQSQFGVPTNSLAYSHSILNLNPQIAPYSELDRLALKLHFRHSSGKDLVVTIDSIPVDKHTHHVKLNQSPRNLRATLIQSFLDNGCLQITLEGDEGNEFVLNESEMILKGKFETALDVDHYLVETELPSEFSLNPNFPNPFNPSTKIEFSLPVPAQTRIAVFNVAGQTVRRLIDGYLEAGGHAVVWDGKNNGGESVASGIYFYRIDANGFSDTKKMILMK